jgi:hypothetical protein
MAKETMMMLLLLQLPPLSVWVLDLLLLFQLWIVSIL